MDETNEDKSYNEKMDRQTKKKQSFEAFILQSSARKNFHFEQFDLRGFNLVDPKQH